MAAKSHAVEPPVSAGQSGLLAAGLVGAAVAVGVGVYGRLHDPAGQQTITGFFGSTLAFKAWMATVVLLFALLQVITALRMWGKISWPGRIPP